MHGERPFLDTNIVVYAFAQNEPRSVLAEQLLLNGGLIAVQTLNEFVFVAQRKLFMSWQDLTLALEALRILFPEPIPLTMEVHEKALRIAERYDFRIHDALLLAAAIGAGCRTFLSEDMRDGQVIEGMRIRNPFRQEPGHAKISRTTRP